MNHLLAGSVFFMLLFCFPLFLSAQERDAPSADYLEDDWGADFDVVLVPENEPASENVNTNALSGFWDHAALKVKGDLAYKDEISIARTQARFDAAARPFDNAFFKLDLQYNYYHEKDALVNASDTVQHALRINDLWLQYTHQACNAKMGRQKLFWGAVEGSYALDVLMPLDLTEPLLTDFSLIRRSQDMAVFTCFMDGLDAELFFTPQPLLDQTTIRQHSDIEELEDSLDYEWGGRLTKHFAGLDISLLFAQVYENTPFAVIDFNTGNLAGLQVDQFNLFGLSMVYAIDRLLLELDVSYQQEKKRFAIGASDTSDTLKYRNELAIGFEYTTDSNHQFSAGAWFFSYLSPLEPQSKQKSEIWNLNWSKQYLNDDLTLSTLALWQTQPDNAQLTLMADYLWDDQWSSALALGYRALSSGASSSALGLQGEQGWNVQLSVAYQL